LTCLTPDTFYNISISDREINLQIKLPMDLKLTEAEAESLDKNLHNAVELVLAMYFKK